MNDECDGKGGAVVILSTAPASEAGDLARYLVERHLAACVNVIPVQSFYRWEGTVHHEPEELLIIKTTADLTEQITVAICSHHSYQVPEVIALPIIGGSVPYLDWVREMTGEPPV
ncbi:divalent-cation tolerance protein CutA [Methanosphaerula palustris]|uniref:CutA1 divalent ion tolerance protein n=1 Tax=Methanosphaerula palustris (strain ATCC BAA-1556 / DSM 19958 / E1-9c) TaxID=521011 RepID=B8GI81_METPE|nr:divalent-cation tolerance protein CutA [Methanosphaerula palustris]ACL15432.1 CutA1 divalent ion tolerance protein [Methanosphaerula palustris E1-9c]